MTKLPKILLLILALQASVFAVKNKLPRRNAAWSTLSIGQTNSEGRHGSLAFNFRFDDDMYSLQFQLFQVCDPDGCVSRPHSSYNFLYGKSYAINHLTHLYAQSGLSYVQLRVNCNPLQLNRENCTTDSEPGLPLRAGLVMGNFTGFSLEIIGLITPNYQILGGQVGLPLGVF